MTMDVDKNMDPSLAEIDSALLKQTFEALVPQGEALCLRFYEALFHQYPEVEPLFEDSNMAEQSKKLLSALSLVVSSFVKKELPVDALKQLGVRHQSYGALAGHYQAVAEVLLNVIQEFAGELWTNEVERVWSDALNIVATTMMSAYSITEDSPMAATKQTKQSGSKEVKNENALRTQAALDNAMTAIMMIDLDLVITYANKATVSLLSKHADALSALYPGFSVDNIIGTCIDIFHKNPAHQRRLLADPSNLPYLTEIEVGPLKFALNVTAQVDAAGNYIGTTLEWSDVTELRAKETTVARLQGTVDGAMTAMMMIDRNFMITYANRSTLDLLKQHEVALSAAYPGFSVDKMIGSCIDMFHKNPAHQRTLLANSTNLPYQTDIAIGDLKFSLNVTAIMDAEGHYVGNALEWSDVTELRQQESINADFASQIAAISKSQAVIEFNMDGTIIQANDNFLNTLGYRLEEVQGKHHRMFVDSSYAQSAEYSRFWENLKAGEYDAGRYMRLNKSGEEVWIQASYNPIFDLKGQPFKVVKYATDVTAIVEKEIEVARLQSAIDGAQSNMMLCDLDLNITYVNLAVVAMLSKREHELRQVFPSFDPRNLVGQNIDQFHKNPSHQRSLLGNKHNLPAKAEIKVANLEFEVNATPILDGDGNLMGNMVEWRDITEQKDAERQMQALIESASAGDLSKRIDATSYDGFMLTLADGINQMMNAVVDPIQEGTRVMQALAEGDLTQNMQGEFKGEFAVLREAIDTSVNNLRNMVGDIRTSASAITSGAGEIAQGNQDLSQRTEEQASSLEETASSMEELTGTVRQNADNAKQANQLAAGARGQAEKGGDVVSNAISAMSEINSSSKKIADIIGVIDEIAFQTNLLALNAAVEAARAGEQGRGFAVVAAEVRNLAQRSAAAAKEIKGLINDSVEKVDDGSRLVNESGETLSEIVTAVKKVSDIIAEIAAASQEQSSGIEQVNKAVAQMDEVTQQNAALVEQAAAASESLDDQAKGLDQLMTYFNTGAAQHRPQAMAPATSGMQQQRRPAPARGQRRPAPVVTNAAADEWEEF